MPIRFTQNLPRIELVEINLDDKQSYDLIRCSSPTQVESHKLFVFWVELESFSYAFLLQNSSTA